MKKPVIMIVDDEDKIIISLTRALMDDGYRIIGERSGVEALEKMKQHEVDLVISDQSMPGVTGTEFLKQVKLKYPYVITIMLTAHGDLETAMEAINDAGIYKFILKPWDENELRQTVRRAVELRRLLMERDGLMEKIKANDAIFRDLEKEYPGITRVVKDKDGNVLALD